MSKTELIEQDILIGQYTLGLLSAKEHVRVHTLLTTDASAAQRALHWESEFLALVDALPPATPPQELLNEILNTLDLPAVTQATATAQAVTHATTQVVKQAPATLQPNADTRSVSVTKPKPVATEKVIETVPNKVARPSADNTPVPASNPTSTSNKTADINNRRRSRTMRLGTTVSALVVAAGLALFFWPNKPSEPPIVVLEVAPSKGAILQAPGQSSTPGWVVTIDLENNVTMVPKVHTEVPANASVQLWTYSKAQPAPRSLGLIDPNQPVAVPASLMGDIAEDQFFEMTLEPVGGSSTLEPTGAILFIGRVVTFSQ